MTLLAQSASASVLYLCTTQREREREKERERDILLIKLFVRSPSLVRFGLISFGLLGHTLSKRTDLCRTNVSPHLVECVGPLIMADGDNGAKAVSQ